MSALTQDRNTVSRSRDFSSAPVAAGAKIYAGALVMISATGFAQAGATATTLTGFGRAEEYVDNTGGADGAASIRVGRKTYRYDNSTAADAITLADVGKQAYAVDDQTVAKTDGGGTRSHAGTIFDVDASGVWLAFS